MDSKTAVEIREKVEAFVQDLANEYGISPQVGRVTYGSDFARMKVEFGSLTESGVPAFIQDGAKFGIKASDYNRVFTAFDGKEYQIVGVRPRARKRPVIIKRLTDCKEFASSLRQALIASNR